MKIQKRDGRIVDFDQNKIIDAILAAFEAVDGKITDYAYEKAGNIADFIEETATTQYTLLTVETIQDLVEKGLMSTKRKDVAKAYILYREERNKIRQNASTLMKKIESKISAKDVQNSNANMDEKSFGGRVGEVKNEVMKYHALNNVMSRMSRENHLGNMIYIHDLDSYSIGQHNCLTLPLGKLLKEGFNTKQVDIRPANSINTAMQLVAVLFQLQSLQQFGGVSAGALDWTMVPYVRKSFRKHFEEGLKWIEDNNLFIDSREIEDVSIEDFDYMKHPKVYDYAITKTKKELKQACEGMFHNLNSLQSRSGNQLPFSSINYGTCTLIEGRMVTEAILKGSIAGVGKFHKTSVFPCQIFQSGKGINQKPEDPNYDLFQLALESTAKRLYPNYANIDWSVNAGYDKNDPDQYVSTMGKRKL